MKKKILFILLMISIGIISYKKINSTELTIFEKRKLENIINSSYLNNILVIYKDGVIIANAGSISLPKNGTKNSYLILDNGSLTLKDLDGKEI